MQKYNNDEILVSKKEFNKKISEFENPKFTIKYIKDFRIIKCEGTCDLNDLKVLKPPKEPDMTVGSLTIQELTTIIKTVIVKNTLSKENVIQIVDEKLKPINNEITFIKQQMATKKELKPIQNDIKEIKEDIKMLKSFTLRTLKIITKINK